MNEERAITEMNALISDSYKGDYSEYRCPVGFLIEMHPTIRTAMPAALMPQVRFRYVGVLTHDSIRRFLTEYTFSDKEIKRFRYTTFELLYGLMYRNINWAKIISTDVVQWLESIDYYHNMVWPHFVVSIIYTSREVDNLESDYTVSRDLELYRSGAYTFNRPGEWYDEYSPYMACISMWINAALEKSPNHYTYTEQEATVLIPNYYYHFLSVLGFTGKYQIQDKTTFHRNNLFSFV